MDRGAWWATVTGVTESQIRLFFTILFYLFYFTIYLPLTLLSTVAQLQ